MIVDKLSTKYFVDKLSMKYFVDNLSNGKCLLYTNIFVGNVRR